MTTYEFHLFAEPAGAEAEKVLTISCVNDKDAIKHGRELAATRVGAVDVARTGHGPWNARYLATAKKAFDSDDVTVDRLD